MKKSALTLLIFLTMTSVTFGVSLGLTDDGPVVGFPTLHSYTLTATGTGIQTMSKFTITNPVNQFFANSEWLADGSAFGDVDDTFVIFGDLRIPDLEPLPIASGPKTTTETIDVGIEGPGTLNNFFDPTPGSPDSGDEEWDAYLLTATPPSLGDVSHDLIHLVIAGHDPGIIDLAVRIITATNQDPVTLNWTTTTHDLTWPVAVACENGDTDCDLDIDFDDFVNFSSGWFGPNGADPVNATPPASWATGDNDGDGNVDFDDFVAFSGSVGVDGWFGPNGAGAPPVGSAAVPEPSTIVMLILGALCLVGYRVRK